MEIHAPTQGVNLVANASPGTPTGALLMTCRVLSHGPDGSSIQARALLDSIFVSFISERLAQALCLKRSDRHARIHGIAGLSHDSLFSCSLILSFPPYRDSLKRSLLALSLCPE